MPRARGRKRACSQRQMSTSQNKRAKPTVINLDVTYSSDEARSPSPCTPKPVSEPQVSLDLSPDVRRRGIMSDSDSDCTPVTPVCLTSPAKMDQLNGDDEMLSSSSVDDLFYVDYNLYHQKAMEIAAMEIKNMEKKSKSESCEQRKECDLSPELFQENDDVSIIDDVRDENPSLESPASPSLLDVKISKRKKIKHNRKTIKSLKFLNSLSERMKKQEEMEDNFNLSLNNDVVLICDDEDTEITLRVKWGSDYLRLPMKSLQKFSYVYQELAERFRVSVSQIVLSHKDKVISSELCPKDLNLTIADLIEGGIQSQACTNNSEILENDPHCICIKVQNADRKGVVNINMNRYDKMIVLMQKYANEKCVNMDKLKFCFDGEILNPNDTPDSLDLDGGECIDVFETQK
ncbi:NFATC2-interacting protein-like [Cherax quadricarinatus]|uniref:NFATC2-interacting protein-like n=1 Tax=Cherax quadricarinatus TaxID=27406 RepID=UPI002379058A|nr:uncharacterized protein LOC128693449 [Cherax quadricarinatus]